MKPTHLTLLALTLTLAAGLGHAQAIWKWKDKDGRIQISDRAPPNDVPARDILSQPPGASSKAGSATPAAAGDVGKPAAAPAAPAASGVDSALEKKRKQDAADKASQQAAAQAADKARVAATKAENCSRARGHMAALESGQRMSRMNANGEREFLDDAARAAESARTRQLMDSNCQ